MIWYILDDENKPVRCDDRADRRRWIESLPEDQRTGIGRIVEVWNGDGGKLRVSTSFLGSDHRWSGDVPILFETMIFGGTEPKLIERYSTWDEAKAGHARIVEEVKRGKHSSLLCSQANDLVED